MRLIGYASAGARQRVRQGLAGCQTPERKVGAGKPEPYDAAGFRKERSVDKLLFCTDTVEDAVAGRISLL